MYTYKPLYIVSNPPLISQYTSCLIDNHVLHKIQLISKNKVKTYNTETNLVVKSAGMLLLHNLF